MTRTYDSAVVIGTTKSRSAHRPGRISSPRRTGRSSKVAACGTASGLILGGAS
jgi:hypothetical protein